VPASSTAIVLFSHRPEREWCNKQFVPGDYATSTQVAHTLHTHTVQTVHRSGYPVIEVDGAAQRGETFGARLTNAFADAFDAGYDHVIAVGGDCPTLHEVDWHAVRTRLANGQPVLGPTPGGGTYLIGLHRSHFDANALAHLPWQSSQLGTALHDHLRHAHGSVACLTSRRDVNTVRDLVALLRQPPRAARPLADRLRRVLGWSTFSPRISLRWIHTPQSAGASVRGPPAAHA
jgi:2-phospho-L-lactate guanylyltransferase (CobY/MobA/RfbA family)